jgi:hypothetical protein
MRGLPGDSEDAENPIMPNNSFKPTPLRGAPNSGVRYQTGHKHKSLNFIVFSFVPQYAIDMELCLRITEPILKGRK